jgi:hypothetical protein
MSRCTSCDADLIVRTDGKLYCTGEKCPLRMGHPNKKYPTFLVAQGK